MKIIILTVFSFSLFSYNIAQVTFEELNYFKNSSFEEFKENETYPAHQHQFYKLKNWTSRTLFEYQGPSAHPSPSICCFHSPDWFIDGVTSTNYNFPYLEPFTGNGFAGMAPFEMMQQRFSMPIQKNRKMLFTSYILYSDDPPVNYNYNRKFEVLFSQNQTEYKKEYPNLIMGSGFPVDYLDCSEDYRKINKITLDFDLNVNGLDIQSVGAGNWFPIELEFFNTANTNRLEWFSLNQSSEFDYCTDTYFTYDDFSIIPASCNECPVAQFIQNKAYTHLSENLIKAQHAVVIGSHIKPPINGQGGFGEVFFGGSPVPGYGSSVKIEAGNEIVFKPGTIIQAGASVQTEIKPCVIENGVDDLTALAVTGVNGCSGNSDFVIFTNATDYFVQIYDRWGALVAEKQGELIPGNNNDNIRIPYGYQNFEVDFFGHVFVWQAWISNCKETKFFSGNVTVFYNCSNKTEHIAESFKDDLLWNVFPNPANENLHIQIESNSNSSKIIQVFNLNGALVLEKKYRENSFVVDVSNLSSGVYSIRLINNDESKIKTFVKN
jgi:hypothetical protein